MHGNDEESQILRDSTVGYGSQSYRDVERDTSSGGWFRGIGWVLVITWLAFLHYNLYLHENRFRANERLIESLENAESAQMGYNDRIGQAIASHAQVMSRLAQEVGLRVKKGTSQ